MTRLNNQCEMQRFQELIFVKEIHFFKDINYMNIIKTKSSNTFRENF